MNMKKNVIQTLISLTVIIGICSCTTSPKKTTQKEEATGKWVKYENNPVLGGGDLGTHVNNSQAYLLLYKSSMEFTKELYDLNYIIFSPNLLLRTHIPSLTSNTPF